MIDRDRLEIMRLMAEAAPPGAFVEVGVYRGGSAAVLYEVAQRQNRQLFLYDTFEGMPGPRHWLDANKPGDLSDCDYETVRAMFPNAAIIKGVFPESCEIGHPVSVAFVHADVDQYHSTAAICRFFPSLMVRGGMILFDDYRGLRGCIEAVDEHFPRREVMPDGRAVVKF